MGKIVLVVVIVHLTHSNYIGHSSSAYSFIFHTYQIWLAMIIRTTGYIHLKYYQGHWIEGIFGAIWARKG